MATPYVISSDLVSAYPAKSLEIAQYIDGFKADLALVQNAQTGTTYTLAAADFTKTVTLSNASPVAVTLPLEATVPWPSGTQLRLLNLGAGLVTVAGAVGVTINGSPLTLAQYRDGTLIKTGTDVWTFVGSPAAPGMDLITPTSVAGSGVTVSGGKVSFSASTTVSVNGCFTSAYDNYLLLIDTTAASAAAVNSIRLRLAGSDAATAYFSSLVFANYAADTGGFIGSTLGTTGFAGLYMDTSGGAAVVDIFSPALARKSVFSAQCPNAVSNGNSRFSQGQHTTGTAYDGFSVIPASGNITGSLRIYGMRNS